MRRRHKARAVALFAIEAGPGRDGHRGPNLSSMSARISPQDGQRTGKGCVPRERWPEASRAEHDVHSYLLVRRVSPLVKHLFGGIILLKKWGASDHSAWSERRHHRFAAPG
jgi:hypothetical protein